MSIRVTIAKWLAPELVRYLEYWEQACTDEMSWRFRTIEERNAHRAALIKIANSRTEYPNATVKRMADIAEAALSHSQAPSPNTPTPERETR